LVWWFESLEFLYSLESDMPEKMERIFISHSDKDRLVIDTLRESLENLEQAEGNKEAAARARQQAIQLFLAYRRDSGENHEPGGRLCAMVLQALQTEQTEEMVQGLTQFANSSGADQEDKLMISKLLDILAGSRDPALVEDEGLYYRDAVELNLLLEKINEEARSS
jgi:hypothetical protein